jgi:hydrogenase maturation protease
MKRALLIGIGNTLRGDDGVGIRVAEQARTRFPHLDVLCVHGLAPELAEIVAQCDLLLIVDASTATPTLRAGEVTPAASGGRLEAHAMTTPGILGLAATLYGRTPARSVLIEVPAFTCDFGEALSPRTAEHIEPCLDVIESYLARP